MAAKANKSFVVIRETQMPGILLELGFLITKKNWCFGTGEFKDNAAQGILRGIVDFLIRDENEPLFPHESHEELNKKN